VIGIQWNNFFIPESTGYGIVGSPGFIFLFSILGAVIHFTLAVYVNSVFPGKYGVPKDPLYFLNASLCKNAHNMINMILKKDAMCICNEIKYFYVILVYQEE